MARGGKKKFAIIGVIVGLVLLVAALPLMAVISMLNVLSTSPQYDGMDTCINFQIGSGVSVNGLSAEQSANAVIIVQEAMKRNLGKDGAAIGVMAALNESGLMTDPGGDNWSEPEYMWSMGLYQTKLWYQFQEAWKKPGGGLYPKSDPASIQRAKDMALNPQKQAEWFMRKLSGEDPSTKSLSNYRWRTDAAYRGKPWMVAQKIEASAFKDGRNYKAVWNGSKGVSPTQIVEDILNSNVGADAIRGDGSTFTTLTTAFPNLPVNDATGKYIIPGPANAKTSTSGYPVLPDSKKWLVDLALPNNKEAKVAKWTEAAFGDLFTRWQASDVLTKRFDLTKTGATITGWTPADGPLIKFSDYTSGTAINLYAGSLKPKKTSGSTNPISGITMPATYTSALTNEEVAAIEKIVADMGGVLTWGGANNPSGAGYFYITPNLGPQNIEGWNSSATSLGMPPYFFVGDSIGRSIKTALESEFPEITVDSVDSRKTAAGISVLRKDPAAKAAKTWIVELGTNDGNNEKAFKGYIDTVMTLAGNRTVFWVNAYRPTTNGMGDALVNNAVLASARTEYPNLKVIDWHTLAVANLGWFTTDPTGMKLHPQGDGKQALVDALVQAATGNGTSDLTGMSSLCGSAPGNVADEAYIIPNSGQGTQVTNNPTIVIPKGMLAANRAKSFVGNPPTSCSNANCRSNCGHLSGRAWGQAHTGYETAWTQWEASVAAGIAVKSTLPNGEKNPEAYQIPIGGLLYWTANPGVGHVATYVGDGMIVSNYHGPLGDGVYLVPMYAFDGYGTYVGWAPPIWGA